MGAGVEVGRGDRPPRLADLLLELGGRLDEQHVPVGFRIYRELAVRWLRSAGVERGTGARAYFVFGGLGDRDRGSGGGEDRPALLANADQPSRSG